MSTYQILYNDEGVVTGYRFDLDIPRGLTQEEIYQEADWILAEAKKILPAEEFRRIEQNPYTLRREKMKPFRAEISILLRNH